MNVHILATCRKPELAPFTELVFKTLRVGFPTANVTVHTNGFKDPRFKEICRESQCQIAHLPSTIHHKWIDVLVEHDREPFYILDTDVIFYDSFERFQFTGALAGWRIPEWRDEFSGCVTRSRLHTSLLYIDPVKVRAAVAKFWEGTADTEFTPKQNLFYPTCTALNGNRYFHDTCSLLYHAIGGQEFSAQQLDSYFHFNFGTIPDVVLPRLSNGTEMEALRDKVMDNPELGRGRWREQMAYYAARPALPNGRDVIAPIDSRDGKEAARWNAELCRGNAEAMNFCDMWYQYCHGIDDLIDTMQDDRPVMSREQILSLFLQAAIFYNSPFFVKHRDLLFPVVIQTTNTYADSVAWESSPKPHLRAMADVFRTCGNEMYFMVALIVGGIGHMRDMSQKIKEKDWLFQHDSNGNPT